MVQSDMGINRCITDEQDIIIYYEDISTYLVGGIGKYEVTVICSGIDLLPWYSREGILNLVPVLFSS